MAAVTTAQTTTTPTTERRSLGETERKVVRAIAEAMFSEDGEVDQARLDHHVDEVDAHVTSASRTLCISLRILLFVVRLAPMLMLYRACMLESLPISERVVVLSRLERSKLTGLSLAFVGWRTVMTLVFYEHPEELKALGYTTNERVRYKRALPVMVPVPADSGVRLRDPDSEVATAADDSGAHAAHREEVA